MRIAGRQRDAALILMGSLAALPLLNGGFARGAWTGIALVVALASILLLRSRPAPTEKVPPLCGGIALALLAAALFGSLQLIPLPHSVLAALAPGATRLDLALGRPAGRYPLSLDPAATRTTMAALLSGVVVLLVASRCVIDRRAVRFLSAMIVGSAVLVAFAGIVDYCKGTPVWHPDEPANARPFGPFVNRNNAATLLVLALPMAVALGRDWITNGKRAAGNAVLLCAVVLFVGLLFNGSRGGALALVAAIGLGILLVPLMVRKRIAALAATVALVALPGLASTRVGETTTVDERVSLGRDSVTMADDAPWCGIGLGAFDLAYRPYHSVERFLRFEHVESEPLEILVEGGVPLFLLAMGAGWMVLAAAARVLRRRPSDWLPAGVALGVTAFCLHACFDFPLRIPGLAVVLLLALSLLGRVAEERA